MMARMKREEGGGDVFCGGSLEKKVADVLVAAATLAAILATSCTATPSASDVCDSPPSSASQFLASVNSSAYFIFNSHFIFEHGKKSRYVIRVL